MTRASYLSFFFKDFFFFPPYSRLSLFPFTWFLLLSLTSFCLPFSLLLVELLLLLHLLLLALFTFPMANSSYRQYRGFHFPSGSIPRVPCCHVLSSHSSRFPAWCWLCWLWHSATCGTMTLHSCRTQSCSTPAYATDVFYGEFKGWEPHLGIISLLPPLPICWCWSFSHSPPEILVLNMSSSPHLNQVFPEDLGYPGLN